MKHANIINYCEYFLFSLSPLYCMLSLIVQTHEEEIMYEYILNASPKCV